MITLDKKEEPVYESSKLNGGDIIKYIRKLRHSAFCPSVSYETFESMVNKCAFDYFNKEGGCMNEAEMGRAFEILGYLHAAGLHKSEEFHRFLEKNGFALPENLDSWKEHINSIDESVLRQIGRLEFYNMFHKQDPRSKAEVIIPNKDRCEQKIEPEENGIAYLTRRILEGNNPRGLY